MTCKQEDSGEDPNLLKRIEHLEKALEWAIKSNGAARGSSSKKTGSKKGAGARGASGRGKSNSEDGAAPRSSLETHPCHICKELGHWCKECPKRKDKSKEEANVQTVTSSSLSPTKIYITAELNGEPVRCLLDCGCERSVIARDLVPNAMQ